MLFSRPSVPFLSLEDLGVELEEDSEDFTQEEAEAATDTESLEDFTKKLLSSATSPVTKAELRRRSGILYSRITLEAGTTLAFKIEWIRKGVT